MTRIPITIGTLTREYVVYITTAPRDYDGFGTFTLPGSSGSSKDRTVLIAVDQIDWQTSRYASGNHKIEEVPDPTGSLRPWVAERLWNHLLGKSS